VAQIDPAYVPGEVETKQVYGVHLQQRRNNAKIDAALFNNIVTKSAKVRPALVAVLITL
jgi:phosphoribosylaminoimidazolecarboxamide formyltransferase/IMP cyclohydrolase